MIPLAIDNRGKEVLGNTVDDVREKDEPLRKRLMPRKAVTLGSALGGRSEDGVAVEKILSHHDDDIGGSGCVGVFDELGNHRSERGCKVKVVDNHSVECVLPSKVEVVQGEYCRPFVREVIVIEESVRSAMVLHEWRKEVESLGNGSKERRLVVVWKLVGFYLDA